MTNTKFRKRALLSSVAMLLVALVALGSATFAWFSTTTTATAGQIQAKTAKSSNILVGEGNAATGGTTDTGVVKWDSNITFAKYTSTNSTSMKPVTTADLAAWSTNLADDFDLGYSTDTATSVSDIKTNGGYAKFTKLYIQSVAADKEIEIIPTVTYPTNGSNKGLDYIRVGLKPIATGQEAATAAFASTEAGSKAIIFDDGNKNDMSKTGIWDDEDDTADPSANLTGTLGSGIHVGKALADKAYGFEVYVYYEGTDFNCVDANAGTDLLVDFTVQEYVATP